MTARPRARAARILRSSARESSGSPLPALWPAGTRTSASWSSTRSESSLGIRPGESSGVIHSGLYYTPGSLEARPCAQGAAELYRYCEERSIPTNRCGKVVVATQPSELARLEELHRRGLANSVPGLELIGPERLRELEPHAAGIRALHCPSTGIIDFRLVAAAYARDIEEAGGEILLGREVTGVVSRDGRVLLQTTGEMSTRGMRSPASTPIESTGSGAPELVAPAPTVDSSS